MYLIFLDELKKQITLLQDISNKSKNEVVNTWNMASRDKEMTEARNMVLSHVLV